jgi:hypothetical protein
LVGKQRHQLLNSTSVTFDEVACAINARGYEVPAAGIEVMRNWANAGNLLGPIEGHSLGEKIDAMLRVRPQQCSFVEFVGLSTIQRLHEGHDTSFVTFAGNALLTVESAAYDGLREAHRVMVSRALWSHTSANAQGQEPLPPRAVLNEYPEMRQAFPEQFTLAEKEGKVPERRFTGVGHLEETGYIPAGRAAERDAGKLPTVQQLAGSYADLYPGAWPLGQGES